MKVFIRKPFAVHLERIVETEQGGAKLRQLVVTPHFSDDNQSPIELSKEDVLAHLHKLEPVDDEATKFFGDYHAKKDAARASMLQPAGASTEELVASAVTAALVKAGLIGTPAAKTKTA